MRVVGVGTDLGVGWDVVGWDLGAGVEERVDCPEDEAVGGTDGPVDGADDEAVDVEDASDADDETDDVADDAEDIDGADDADNSDDAPSAEHPAAARQIATATRRRRADPRIGKPGAAPRELTPDSCRSTS